MKKSLLLILSLLFAAFALTGCSEDDKKDKSEVTSELTGTYKITFFGTQVTNVNPDNAFAKMFYITNNCEKAKELYPDIIGAETGETFPANINQCTEESNTILMENSSVVISITDDDKLAITSRVQMSGGAVEASAADKYQFTEYYPTNSFTDNEASGKGVKGWNYDVDSETVSAEPAEFPNSPYKITKQEDGSLMIKMTLVGKKVELLNVTVDAVTTVIMEPVSKDTAPLEKELLPFPATED